MFYLWWKRELAGGRSAHGVQMVRRPFKDLSKDVASLVALMA
jgi:hypothetical protein